MGKKREFNIVNIIQDKYYLDWVKSLEEKYLIPSRTRDFYDGPLNVLYMQIKLMESIVGIEKAVKEAKQKTKTDKRYEYSLFLHKQLLRIIKSIADGIAWRILKFDRPFLRIMAESKKYSSSVQFLTDSYKKTILKAFELTLMKDSNVLLNDITNFLRLGDITEIKNGVTQIHELKKAGKKIINLNILWDQIQKNPKAKVSKQIKKLIAAQVIKDRRILLSKNQLFRIEDLPLKFENNIKEVEDLINIAEQELYKAKVFDNYLRVTCFNMSKLINDDNLHNKIIKKESEDIKFGENDVIIPISNFDIFYEENGNFARNATPYSIFPFDVSICMKLLYGHYHLVSFINYSEIKRIFLKNGWEVIEHYIEKISEENEKIKMKLFDGELFENKFNEAFFSIKKDNFTAEVSIVQILRIGIDFMKPELLVNMYEEVKNSELKIGSFCFLNILDEKEVWI